MDTFINQQVIVCNNTLLLGERLSANPVCSQTEDGQTIRKIGAGAFRGKDNPLIRIPACVEEIGENAFEYTSAERVFLENPWIRIGSRAFWQRNNIIKSIGMRLTKVQYRELMDQSRVSLADRVVVDREALPQKMVDMLQNAFAVTLSCLPDKVTRLFLADTVEEVKKRPVLYKEMECLDFREGNEMLSEDEAFLELIRNKDNPKATADQDISNDWYRKADRREDMQIATLFYFRPSQIMADADYVDVCFERLDKVIFWQSYQKIAYKGKDYYLYQRNYATNRPVFNDRPAFPLREDIAIYTDQELLTDFHLSEEIYAKYRLLTLL